MAAFSVLMPIAPWETPDVLYQALRSLSDQTCQPSEVILSIDGSLPPSLRDICQHIYPSAKIIVGPGGEGVGPVLARGLLHCQHDYVVRADSDDISLPHRFFLQLAAIACLPHVVVLGANIREFNNDSHPSTYTTRRIPLTPSSIASSLKWRNPVNHPSVIMRRSCILDVGNYRHSPGFEDYDLWLRVFKRYGPSSIANMDDQLVLVRTGSAHIERRHGVRYALNEITFLLRSGKESLLPFHIVLVLIILRIPFRLMPKPLLLRAMALLRK